jgi:ribonuclease HI
MDKTKILCTIYTDASYKVVNNTVISTGAMYAKCQDQLLKESFPFENNSIVSPTHAEAETIFRAIKKCYEKWGNLGVIFVNTDSLAVCHSMWPEGMGRQHFRINKSQKEAKSVIVNIRNFIKEKGLEQRFKHVKAHQGGKDIRSWVNEVCDSEAKKERLKIEKHV